MKILIRTFSEKPGSSINNLCTIFIHHACKNGAEVTLILPGFVPADCPEMFKFPKNYKIKIINFKRNWHYFLDKFCYKLFNKTIDQYLEERFIRNSIFDYILMNEPSPCYCFVFSYWEKFLKLIKIPYGFLIQVNVDNGIFFNIAKDKIDILKKCHLISFVSIKNKESLQCQIGFDFPNYLILNNPCSFSNRSKICRKYSGKCKFLMVGRLAVNVKGQDIVLKILGNLKWATRDWELIIAGDGPDRDYLCRLSKYLGLESRVMFIGHVNNIIEIYSRSNIFLMPSYAEGKPLALTEALVCGLPSVATDVGGNAELIDDGLNGFLASAPSVPLFEEAMEKLFINLKSWSIYSDSAHEKGLNVIDSNGPLLLWNKIVKIHS